VNDFPHHCLPIADAIRADHQANQIHQANTSRQVKTITLFYSPTARAWVSEMRFAQRDLSGTIITPTAFTDKNKGFDVLNEMRRLNPDALVSLADCGTAPASFGGAK
jgi:hypothetical protein